MNTNPFSKKKIKKETSIVSSEQREQSQRNFTRDPYIKEERINAKGCVLGYDTSRTQNNIICYDPDNYYYLNGHVLVIGISGAGKTTFIKKNIIEKLNNQIPGNTKAYAKDIIVMDFQGDMGTQNETHYEYTARNSQYGLNPFSMEQNSKNGGPNIQSEMILAFIKDNLKCKPLINPIITNIKYT